LSRGTTLAKGEEGAKGAEFMREIIVIQHHELETLGTWQNELNRWHAHPKTVRMWLGENLPDPTRVLAAILLGGPMNVHETAKFPFLIQELSWINQLVALDRPMLGICLGAQLMAAVLGAEVKPGPAWEIGPSHVILTPQGAEDRLLAGFPMSLPVYQWHGQGFTLPPGALSLAYSEGYPCQAFRRNRAWGLQFHLEMDPALASAWLDSNSDDLKNQLSQPEILRKHSFEALPEIMLYGRQVIRRFWDFIAE
jgi:GMP synthase-like glutamine amidotransferase